MAVGCAEEDSGRPPPIDRLHYPVSVAVLQDSPASEGTLYVVNSNFDLRFNRGWVTAVDVATALATPGQPLTGVAPENVALVDSFGGNIALYQPSGAPANQRRLFIPTRSDNKLFVVEAQGTTLTCAAPTSGAAPVDCTSQGIDLVENDRKGTFDPFDAEIRGNQLFVAPLRRAIAPGEDSGQAWLSILDAEAPGAPQLLEMGEPPSESILGTAEGLFISGRSISTATNTGSQVLRFLSLAPGVPLDVKDSAITDETRIKESRGLGVSSDGSRLFVTTRGPDASSTRGLGPDGLLIVDITIDPANGLPRNRVLGFEPLPRGPSNVLVLPRAGRRDVVAVSCTNDNKVAFFDDELGEVVALADSTTPSGLAQATKPASGTTPAGRRVFVASFEGQSVDVIELPEFDNPTKRIAPKPEVKKIGVGVE